MGGASGPGRVDGGIVGGVWGGSVGGGGIVEGGIVEGGIVLSLWDATVPVPAVPAPAPADAGAGVGDSNAPERFPSFSMCLLLLILFAAVAGDKLPSSSMSLFSRVACLLLSMSLLSVYVAVYLSVSMSLLSMSRLSLAGDGCCLVCWFACWLA